MVTQTRVRNEDRRDFTKHMIRLRHAGQINARGEANEIILLNSHDGTSSYQMLAGMFRFVCSNGNRQLYTVTLSLLGVFFSHLINQM